MSIDSIIVTTSNQFNEAIERASGTIFSLLAGEAATFLIGLIVLSFAFFAVQMAKDGVFDFLGMIYFVFRGGLIYSLITGGILWSEVAFPFITEFGENVGLFIYNSTRLVTNVQQLNNVANGVQPDFFEIIGNYYNSIASIGEDIRSQVRGKFLTFNATTATIAFYMMLTLTLFMVSLAFMLLLTTKIFLALFLALAPLFIVWMYLGSTRSIFDGYLSGITKLMITQLLVFATLGFFTSASNAVLEDFAELAAIGGNAENEFLLSRMYELTFLSTVGLLIMISVPVMASALSGGPVSFGVSTINAALKTAGAATRAPGTAARAGASTFRGGQAVANFINSRRGGGIDKAGKGRSGAAAAAKTVKQRATSAAKLG